MKRLRLFFLYSLFLYAILSLRAMDSCSNNVVQFKADDKIVAIEKQNIPLIGALNERYLKHKYKNLTGPVQLLPGFSTQEISLINEALAIHPYEFDTYYHKLEDHKKKILINSSGLYKKVIDKDGKEKMVMGLCVPRITRQLLKPYLQSPDITEVLINKSPLVSQEIHSIITFCLAQSIKKRNVISITEAVYYFSHKRQKQEIKRILGSDLDWNSTFIDGCFTHNVLLRPKKLLMNGVEQVTCAVLFLDDVHELRLIPNNEVVRASGKGYSLYILADRAEQYITHADIVHKADILGHCSMKIDDQNDCFISYSEKDIIISTIAHYDKNECAIAWQKYDIAENEIVVSACCNDIAKVLYTVTHDKQNYLSIVREWKMDGTSVAIAQFDFKKYGVLQNILFIPDCSTGYGYLKKNHGNTLILIFPTEHMRTELFLSVNPGHPGNVVVEQASTELNDYLHTYLHYIQNDSSLLSWYTRCSAFKFLIDRQVQARHNGWFKNLIPTFDNSSNECYKMYSPNGKFIMANSLATALGKMYVKTDIIDSKSGQEICSVDTSQDNFGGVGFSHDSSNLIFFSKEHGECGESVSKIPLMTEQRKNILDQFKKMITNRVGVLPLLLKLMSEINKNGYLSLDNNNPTRKMLLEWSKVEGMKVFMEKCFPFGKS